MSAQRSSEFDENWRVFDDVVAYTRGLVAQAGTEELQYLVSGRIGVYDVTPNNPRATSISIIAEQWLIVTVGGFGGRWELNYTDEHRELARRIIAAAVDGRLEERRAFARSHVTVTFEDGTVKRSTVYDGCGSLLVPQPGWKLWGRRTTFEPFGS